MPYIKGRSYQLFASPVPVSVDFIVYMAKLSQPSLHQSLGLCMGLIRASNHHRLKSATTDCFTVCFFGRFVFRGNGGFHLVFGTRDQR